MPKAETINAVIEAGRYAPSGANSQTTHILVFTERNLIHEMAELVREEFAKMEIREGIYISMRNSVVASKKRKLRFLLQRTGPDRYGK